MTKMVERGGGRGIQLILSAVNPEISELSILGRGGVFKYSEKKKDIFAHPTEDFRIINYYENLDSTLPGSL